VNWFVEAIIIAVWGTKPVSKSRNGDHVALLAKLTDKSGNHNADGRFARSRWFGYPVRRHGRVTTFGPYSPQQPSDSLPQKVNVSLTRR
jgi:hypothetical protein